MDIVLQDGTKIGKLLPLKRWKATITYDDHMIECEIEELSDLHNIVERGPNFYSIAKIEIVINPAIDRKAMVALAAT
jgi:hypothetical protein